MAVFRGINYLTIHIFHGILFFSVEKEGGDNTCLVTIVITAADWHSTNAVWTVTGVRSHKLEVAR